MKILMLVLYFPPAPCGGAEQQCFRQARALAARGHTVSILTPWWLATSSRREIWEGILIRRVGSLLPFYSWVQRLHRRLRLRRVAFNPAEPDPFSADGGLAAAKAPPKRWRWMAPPEWLGYASFLREASGAMARLGRDYDLIHVHGSTWLAGFAQKKGELHGIPVFCKEAGGVVLTNPPPLAIPGWTQWMERRRRCHFIALTPHIREELGKVGIEADRIWVVPNGVGIPAEVAAPERYSSVIYAGNFTQGAVYKAFDVLLEAWALAHREEPGLRLRMFGGGDSRRWQQVAAQTGCGESVEFLGQSSNLSAEYCRSGFLVLPSRVEGLSNVLLEAQAAGLPAVVSDIPGNRAVVQDGENGLVVPVGDANALAEAMIRMYRSPELRAAMGRKARERIRQEFSLERVALMLEQVYLEAIAACHKA